ncbi:hypothetical protein Nepgr_015575 [Nepenthes gracilis]|uniref:Uncharacterized protein n=1 Tax=Nepenthes gracilis TaxID=150966 RepID=A0AAD3SN70_NEPGR|nr:hypothetical protein Nepgr_015575 [Nepenthes gracilis]
MKVSEFMRYSKKTKVFAMMRSPETVQVSGVMKFSERMKVSRVTRSLEKIEVSGVMRSSGDDEDLYSDEISGDVGGLPRG